MALICNSLLYYYPEHSTESVTVSRQDYSMNLNGQLFFGPVWRSFGGHQGHVGELLMLKVLTEKIKHLAHAIVFAHRAQGEAGSLVRYSIVHQHFTRL